MLCCHNSTEDLFDPTAVFMTITQSGLLPDTPGLALTPLTLRVSASGETLSDPSGKLVNTAIHWLPGGEAWFHAAFIDTLLDFTT